MAEPAPVAPTAVPPVRRVYFWPAFVVALLGGHIVLLASVVLLATRDRGFAIEPNYYQNALHWDDFAAQRQANARLRWHTDVTLGDAVSPFGERALICSVHDAGGEPIRDAQVSALAFPHARGVERVTTTLNALGDGRYAATLRFTRHGVWEFRVRAARGGDVFTHVEQRDVYPPGEQRAWRP